MDTIIIQSKDDILKNASNKSGEDTAKMILEHVCSRIKEGSAIIEFFSHGEIEGHKEERTSKQVITVIYKIVRPMFLKEVGKLEDQVND